MMSFSAFEHPYLSGLLGDEEMAVLFSAAADVEGMLAFEAALARAEARYGVISEAAAERIAKVCRTFQPDIAALKTATAIDGVVVPELVKQLRAAVGTEFGSKVHYGATSQDVIDTSLMLRLKRATALIAARLAEIIAEFERLERAFGARPLMGHTRMQAAIPITVSARLTAWSAPLEALHQRLRSSEPTLYAVQFGGAAGTLEKLGDQAAAVRAALAGELGLADHRQWQSQRGRIAEVAGMVSEISGSLGKFGQDIALLAKAGDELSLAGGGGSSAMPHKQNPVAAEVLVSLARFNAVQLSGIHQSLVHEQERSGTAWTLEWLILPQMFAACGTALRLAIQLASQIRGIGSEEP
jgi:3-carboxy-cis,cis-muconate cycloisomerase